MPSASVSVAAALKPGAFQKVLIACLTSDRVVCMRAWPAKRAAGFRAAAASR
jgi:hypothetical protein